MRRPLLRFLQRQPDPIDPMLWQQVSHCVPWLQVLDQTRGNRLRELSALFLDRKTITPAGGLTLSDHERVILAALCCLPLLEFGAEGLHGWSQVLVYPGAFRAHRNHVDDAGVMHEWDDELIGEAWEHGPLLLSWSDVQTDLADPDSGYCVAVHEMAHKLDALDGVLDGTPPLPRPWQRAWASDFQRAYDQFTRLVEAGQETAIDPYAAESPEEFFAVCSEYHFSNPAKLRDSLPKVAAHLARLYGPAPTLTDG